MIHHRLRTPFLCLIMTTLVLALTACEDEKKKEGCGNGLLDLGELCDSTAVGAPSCAELGYYEQTAPITCNADCTWDLSACGSGRCGDGVVQAQHGENCDGENLAESTCQDLALGEGTLACSDSCRFDVSGCELAAVCGDGVIATPSEQCEGDDLAGSTCESLGYDGGTLSCLDTCLFDESGCTPGE